jgi:DNA-directed RNA polymerase specialized sigma24 family protein
LDIKEGRMVFAARAPERREVVTPDAVQPPPVLSREFLCEHIDPVVSRVIWQRLRRRFNPSRRGLCDPDAEDVYQKVLLQLTRALGEGGNFYTGRVNNLQGYVAMTAHRVCTDEIRERAPLWSSRMASVRELFNRHPELATWKAGCPAHPGAPRALCGFEKWRGAGEMESDLLATQMQEAELGRFKQVRFPRMDVSRVKLAVLVAEILDWVGGPVELTQMVDLVIWLQGFTEPTTGSLDDPGMHPDSLLRFNSHPDAEIAASELLTRIWQESRRLPLWHRRTLFLTFDDDAGENILRLLRARGEINIGDAVKALEMSREQLEGVWDALSLDVAGAAEFFGTTKGNVRKWRFRATTRLAEALGIHGLVKSQRKAKTPAVRSLARGAGR